MNNLPLDCCVCLGVLVDPVVGRCGHDFCSSCITRWCDEQLLQQGRAPSCPVCRSSLGDDVGNLAVCLRLKQLTEQLFPEKVAERRRELQQAAAQRSQAAKQDAAARLAAQRGPHAAGRPRYLRVRRTLPPRSGGAAGVAPDPAGVAQAETAATMQQGVTSSEHAAVQQQQQEQQQQEQQEQQQQQQQQEQQQEQQQQQQQQLQAWLAVAATSSVAATATAAHHMLNHQSGDESSGAARGQVTSAWVAPQVNFTLGWCDPPERSRKKPRVRINRPAALTAQGPLS